MYTGRTSGITWSDDKVVSEKREKGECPLPCVRMIDPSGFVCDVPVKAGRGVPLGMGQDPNVIVAQKKKRGWKVHSDCRVGVSEFKSDFASEKEREKYIAALKADKAARAKAYEERTMGDTKALAKALAELTSKNE